HRSGGGGDSGEPLSSRLRPVRSHRGGHGERHELPRQGDGRRPLRRCPSPRGAVVVVVVPGAPRRAASAGADARAGRSMQGGARVLRGDVWPAGSHVRRVQETPGMYVLCSSDFLVVVM
ncbi:Os12g0174800, partial [Oryza sativa Japonica Group]